MSPTPGKVGRLSFFPVESNVITSWLSGNISSNVLQMYNYIAVYLIMTKMQLAKAIILVKRMGTY